eukprot:994356-Amorphochlora_amoeboformis.AAC.2
MGQSESKWQEGQNLCKTLRDRRTGVQHAAGTCKSGIALMQGCGIMHEDINIRPVLGEVDITSRTLDAEKRYSRPLQWMR